jgi:CDP-6-deoxy-D-xylo-4-hexulose-3-dehydrase
VANGATRKDGSPVKRLEIVRYLEDRNVQTRLLFAGNITRQPCFVTSGAHPRKLADFRIAGDLTNTDLIMHNTFWIGVYPRITQTQIEYMAELISETV